MTIRKATPAQQNYKSQHDYWRKKAADSARAGDTAAVARHTYLAELAGRNAGLGKNAGAGGSGAVHAGKYTDAIFARRRAQASATNQEVVHGRAPERPARAAGAAGGIDADSIFTRRRQAAGRTRADGASGAEG